MCFNKWGVCPSEINLKMQCKKCILCLVFGDISAFLLNFELFSLGIFSLCDTCDSKKSTSLLEGARVRAYVRRTSMEQWNVMVLKRSFSVIFPFLAGILFLKLYFMLVLSSAICKLDGDEKCFVTFSWIFPSLEQYRPLYI